MDRRARALAGVGASMSRRAAARRFDVGVALVIRWDAARRATGAFAPKAQDKDMRSWRLEPRDAEVMAAFAEGRDQTLVALCERHAARGIAAQTRRCRGSSSGVGKVSPEHGPQPWAVSAPRAAADSVLARGRRSGRFAGSHSRSRTASSLGGRINELSKNSLRYTSLLR
jgi:transposase